jgi:uncharacterized repeat protein (TIGR04138 family)
MVDFRNTVESICARDSRYKPDSYEFIMQALSFTQGKLKKKGHISGKELARGCAEYAISLYGPMAKTVLSHWGIIRTQDFGNIVYNAISAKLLSKTEEDSIGDFKDVYDFEAAFNNILSKDISALP